MLPFVWLQYTRGLSEFVEVTAPQNTEPSRSFLLLAFDMNPKVASALLLWDRDSRIRRAIDAMTAEKTVQNVLNAIQSCGAPIYAFGSFASAVGFIWSRPGSSGTGGLLLEEDLNDDVPKGMSVRHWRKTGVDASLPNVDEWFQRYGECVGDSFLLEALHKPSVSGWARRIFECTRQRLRENHPGHDHLPIGRTEASKLDRPKKLTKKSTAKTKPKRKRQSQKQKVSTPDVVEPDEVRVSIKKTKTAVAANVEETPFLMMATTTLPKTRARRIAPVRKGRETPAAPFIVGALATAVNLTYAQFNQFIGRIDRHALRNMAIRRLHANGSLHFDQCKGHEAAVSYFESRVQEVIEQLKKTFEQRRGKLVSALKQSEVIRTLGPLQVDRVLEGVKLMLKAANVQQYQLGRHFYTEPMADFYRDCNDVQKMAATWDAWVP